MRTTGRVVGSILVATAVLAVAAAITTIVDLAGRDRAFTIDRFDREVVVSTDGSMAVTETIDVTFRTGRRGIFRDLPPDGPGGRVTYRDLQVDQGRDGAPWNFVTETSPSGDLRVRIGDAAVTLAPGSYTYRLRYTIDDLVYRPTRRPDDVHVRLDVPGFDWPTDVEVVHLAVHVPTAVRDVACVAGPRRTVRACNPAPRVDGRTVRVDLGPFRPRHAATVAIDLDGAAFAADLPTWRARPLERRDGLLPVMPLPAPVSGLVLALFLAVPFAGFEAVKSVLVYRDEVTDPHLHDRVQPSAVYAPPLGLRPVEVAGLLLRHDSEALLLGTLVDLDQRGAVVTRTTGAEDDPIVTVMPGPPGSRLLPTDDAFLRSLLPGGAQVRFDGTYARDTATRTTAATNELQRQARRVFADHGLEHERGGMLHSATGKLLLLLPVVLTAIVLGSIAGVVLAVPGGAVVGIGAVVVAGWLAVRWVWRHHRLPLNSAGRDAVGQARAFRSFLATVEGEQIEWAAGQSGIDHHHPALSLLPYAIVLGLADSWYDRFGSVIRELAAAGAAAGAATGTTWWATRSGYRGTAQARSGSITDPSSSSSVGGGGGGSGGGGGGGGSW